MSEPIAYLNGRLMAQSEARLALTDLGLVLGASVTEMIRTFQHRPYRLNDHLDRLFRSLQAVGFGTDVQREDLERAVGEVLEHNARLIPPSHDLGIVVFVTAGHNLTYLGAGGIELARTPTVCVHTFPLPFELWADLFIDGQHLVTPSVRQLPADVIDPRIKSRSRLHWFLADQQARQIDRQARAVLLDGSGCLTETSTGNIFVVRQGRILTPPAERALGGVSRATVLELAAELDIPCETAELRPYDVHNAEEMLTSSTPYCLLPVTRFNGWRVGDGVPGPVFAQLIEAWNRRVGLDIIAQMRDGARDRRAALGRSEGGSA